MNFVKLAQTKNPAGSSVKYWLHKHLAKAQPARSKRNVHASELMRKDSEFCPRQYALFDLTHKKLPDEFLSTSEAVTFHLGHVLADSIINWLADEGLAVGDWKCESCGRIHKFCKRPVKCTCLHKSFKYVEVRFCSEHSGVSGGIDLLVDFGASKLELIELKTIDKEEFKKIVMPLAEHKWRTNLYLRLVEESSHPERHRINTKKGRVLYVSKGGYGCMDTQPKEWGLKDGAFSPFKEFIVERDDAETEKKSDIAKMVKTFRETGLVPLGVCPTSFCKQAKWCPVSQECFSGKWEGGSYVDITEVNGY